MRKHTGCEWFVETFETHNGMAKSVLTYMDGTPVEIADCSPDFPDGGVANAKLIAAAPALLSALLMVKNDPAYGQLCGVVIAEIEKAIAKTQ